MFGILKKSMKQNFKIHHCMICMFVDLWILGDIREIGMYFSLAHCRFYNYHRNLQIWIMIVML